MAVMTRAVLPLIACVLLALPAKVEAQSRWRTQVNGQIENQAKSLSERGFHRTHDVYDGSLKNEESEYLTLALHAGRSYAILAVCDNDCTDLDLRIFGDDNREIDSDVEDDDYPVVVLSPATDGKFRLKVIMAKCSTSPCFYGVGVYAK
jgi:hypothetical protein